MRYHMARATYPEVVSPVPEGRSELGRAALLRLPIWSCTAESLPSQMCYHTCWWALTLRTEIPHRFTHHLIRDRSLPSAGLFSVALVVGLPRLAVSQSAALRCSDFPLSSTPQSRLPTSETAPNSDRPIHSDSPGIITQWSVVGDR
jgi:hypothetical protein